MKYAAFLGSECEGPKSMCCLLMYSENVIVFVENGLPGKLYYLPFFKSLLPIFPVAPFFFFWVTVLQFLLHSFLFKTRDYTEY